MKHIISSFLIIFGIISLLFGFYLTYIRYSPKTLAFEGVSTSKNSTYATLPVMIKINSIGILLPVVASEIQNNTWETTSDGVSFLKTSAKPGSTGNSVFYGHNWSSILGNLPKTNIGDTIEITMDTGKKLMYIVEYTAVVDPTQTSVVNDVGDERLTIYTCAGFLDTKRFVVVAKPTK